jgi:acyl-coenzyme A thioesterase PaaI-like protein
MAAPQVSTAPPVTAPRPAGPGPRLRRAWARLAPLPGGRFLFSKLVGWMAPYSATVKGRVEELGPGFCRVTIRERRALRNPFDSIHAVALLNAAELASGLATLYALAPGVRGIISRLEIDFAKKARGVIAADCRTMPPREVPTEPLTHVAEVALTDAAGERVATARAFWTLGPGR